MWYFSGWKFGEARCAAILQKIRILDIKNINKNKDNIRPTDPLQNMLCNATADWPATDRAEGEGVRKFQSF